MAPEHADGGTRPVGPTADVYALGAVLYEMPTGRTPFKAASALETMRQVVHDEAAAPSRLQPNLPTDLDTICLKCLEKSPDRRYTSAKDLAEDLERFLAGRRTIARPRSVLSQSIRWCRRHPNGVGIIAIILLAFGAVAWEWGQAELARAKIDRERIHAVEQADQLQKVLRAEELARQDAEIASQLATVFATDLMSGRVGRLDAKESLASTSDMRQRLNKWLPYGRMQLAANPTDRSICMMLHAYVNLMLANINLNDRKFETSRQFCLEAIPLWKELLKSSPDDVRIRGYLAETLENRATSYLNEADWKRTLAGFLEARAEYAELVRRGSQDRAVSGFQECRFYEAICREALGESTEAHRLREELRQDLVSEISKSPKEIWPRNLLMNVLLKNNDLAEACAEARMLLELDPKNWRRSGDLGVCLFTSAKRLKKTRAYREALPFLEKAAAGIRTDLVFQLRKRRVNKIILAGMLANLCVESHLRELLDQCLVECRPQLPAPCDRRRP